MVALVPSADIGRNMYLLIQIGNIDLERPQTFEFIALKSKLAVKRGG